MDIALSVTLGILFVIAALFSTFLLFYLWRHIDLHTGQMPGASPILVRLHAIFELVFLALYLVMMSEMLPRLWNYQVELPPRTVAHVLLGFGVGTVLLLKIAISRLFREFTAWLPGLSALIFTITVLLCGLSVPFALHEYGLARGQAGGSVYSDESRERLAKLLPLAELPKEAPVRDLSTVDALRRGRDVLAHKCVVCHDLKTVLVQPRLPSEWWHTVDRMAKKPTFAEALSEQEQYEVTAYLIAIAGDVSRHAMAQHEAKERRKAAAIALAIKRESYHGPERAVYERVCAECHPLSEIEQNMPHTADEVAAVIDRMINENGLSASKEEIDQVHSFMVTVLVGEKAQPIIAGPQPTPPPEPAEPAEPAANDNPGTGVIEVSTKKNRKKKPRP
jgi:mono/diheme cytochrome c family protein